MDAVTEQISIAPSYFSYHARKLGWLREVTLITYCLFPISLSLSLSLSRAFLLGLAGRDLRDTGYPGRTGRG